jgi:hypothetical protein
MEELTPTWYQQFPACSNDSDRLEDNRKTAEEASLYSMTQILAGWKLFSRDQKSFWRMQCVLSRHFSSRLRFI